MKRAARDRQPNFVDLLSACRRELDRGAPRRAGLHLVCELLRREVSRYDWVGFYLAEPVEGMMVLGPFAGTPTKNLRFSPGEGACGRAARELRTVRVEDALSGERPIVRSMKVQSEIALPLEASGTLVAVLLVDSHRPAAFTEVDEEFLAQLAESAAPYVPRIPRP